MKQRILVLCTGNSCRSQMAEGYLRFFGKSNVEVSSAGLEAHGINPYMKQVMMEDGVDVSDHTSNTIEEMRGKEFDLVLTVCDHAKEHCPWFPGGAERIHESFPDPADAIGTDEEKLPVYREVRDRIKSYCEELVQNYVNEQQQRDLQ